jgi:hypothetical protein
MAHKKKAFESIELDEKAPPLVEEDVDESSQMIEEAAYYIGLNRQTNNEEGDSSSDWYAAEKKIREDLDKT